MKSQIGKVWTVMNSNLINEFYSVKISSKYQFWQQTATDTISWST